MVNATQHELPGAREYGPLENYGVADLPAEAVRQFAPGDARLAVPDHRCILFRRKDELSVKLEIAFDVDGEIGKQVLLIDVDSPEPVAVGNDFHPFDLADAVLVGNGQGKDEGDGVAGDEAAGRGGFHTGVPGIDEGPQHAEGQYGYGYAQDRQKRP